MFYIVQTIVITLMFYNFTKNHYIAPLHSCLMAKICNHTGIKRCGLEKDQQDKRLFLDDCDMFEYNCDYKKAYSEVDVKVCKENITESNTENTKTSKMATEKSPSVKISSKPTTDNKHTTTTDNKHTTTNATTLPTTTTQTQTNPEIIRIQTESMTTVSGITSKCTCMDLQTIPLPNTESTQAVTETVSTLDQTKSLETYISNEKTQPQSETITIPTTPMTPVSVTTTAKCTCTNLQTIPVSNTKSTITSTQISHECNCTQPYSEPSLRTAIDNTTETTSDKFETTDITRVSPNVTKSTTGSSYANVTRIPIATGCTRGKKNNTSIVTAKKQNTNTVVTDETKCTCMDVGIPTSLSHLETDSTTTSTYLESSTAPLSKTTKDMETVSTLVQKNSCTCNSVSLKTYETITTKTEPTIIPTTPMTPVSRITAAKCTCMDLQIIPVTTTESKITSTQTQHECTCTNSPSEYSSITTIDDKTTHTHTSLSNDDSLTTLKHSCDKYPKHCKRPLTWETTAQGETRDFFQILREKFGNRAKLLKDTTHWPRRMAKPIEYNKDSFYFGTHNDI